MIFILILQNFSPNCLLTFHLTDERIQEGIPLLEAEVASAAKRMRAAVTRASEAVEVGSAQSLGFGLDGLSRQHYRVGLVVWQWVGLT